jgi:hypothetical protein
MASADHNLLFGILAVQMDFVGRDALIGAMKAWVLDKARPLGQILVEQGALGTDRRALLEALVREHLRAHGDDPHKSLAAAGGRRRSRKGPHPSRDRAGRGDGLAGGDLSPFRHKAKVTRPGRRP